MGGTAGMSGAAIGRLRQQVQALVDADLILPEDGQWLMAALDRALRGQPAAAAQPSRSDVQGFIERLQSLMQAGVLDAAAASRRSIWPAGSSIRSAPRQPDRSLCSGPRREPGKSIGNNVAARPRDRSRWHRNAGRDSQKGQ